MVSLINWVVGVLGIGALVLNVYVTWRVARDDLSERLHRVMYLMLVWLLPMIGSIIVLFLIRGEEKYELQHYEPMDPPNLL